MAEEWGLHQVGGRMAAGSWSSHLCAVPVAAASAGHPAAMEMHPLGPWPDCPHEESSDPNVLARL